MRYDLVLVRLPPLSEQNRIVAKIEELFSELDMAVESLKTARYTTQVSTAKPCSSTPSKASSRRNGARTTKTSLRHRSNCALASSRERDGTLRTASQRVEGRCQRHGRKVGNLARGREAFKTEGSRSSCYRLSSGELAKFFHLVTRWLVLSTYGVLVLNLSPSTALRRRVTTTYEGTGVLRIR